MSGTMKRAIAKPYERSVDRFCRRLKLAHYRIAESVEYSTHDMKFITVLDLSDKSLYYMDMQDTEQTDEVKLGRITLENGEIKLIQRNTMKFTDFEKALPENVIEPMRTDDDNSAVFEYINDSAKFKSYIRDTLGLLPCRYGLRKKRNGQITTKWYLFSIAYQN